MTDPTILAQSGPIVAGVYARKSTDQTGVGDEAKSVVRQVEHGTAYAQTKGWTVAEEFIFIDDGISGAEFERRPGLMRLLAQVSRKPGPPFDVLIISEKSRLGREATETGYIIKKMLQAGIRISSYLDQREISFESPIDKMVENVLSIADELEREKARARTKDALTRKARAGYVPGGRTFGYTNVRVEGHSEYRINEAEAVIVRRIFNLAAQGFGYKKLAHILNEEGAPAPRSNPDRPRGWGAGTVRGVLMRRLYVGEVTWNRSQKRDGWGQRKTRQRAEGEWIRAPRPELRIIEPALWELVQERLETARASYLRSQDGTLWGRPANGVASKYLLTGMAVCGVCGGALTIRSRSHGTRRLLLYACLTNIQRGRAVCANTVQMRMLDADHAVLETIEQRVLRADIVEAAIEAARARLGSNEIVEQRRTLEAALSRVEKELGHLTAAIAAGRESHTLLAAIRDREGEGRKLRLALDELDALSQVPRLEDHRLLADLSARVQDWQELLRRAPVQARQILRKLLVGRLLFAPENQEGAMIYRFTGTGRLDPVVAGILGGMPSRGSSSSQNVGLLLDNPGGNADAMLGEPSPRIPQNLAPKGVESRWSHHRFRRGFPRV